MEELKQQLLYVKQQNYNNSIPPRKEKDELIKFVEQFLKQKKRKIYGGTALNKFVPIYDQYEEPDYDVYSPTPKSDAIEFGHFLYKNGIKEVNVTRAVVKGTYKVFASKIAVMDLSYMPQKMYDIIPSKNIDGLEYTKPEYLKIDLLVSICNPETSIHRWEKELPRYQKLNQKYELQKIGTNPRTEFNSEADKLLNTYFKNKDDSILTGLVAYNLYLTQSGFNNFYNTKVEYLEVLTTDPYEMIRDLIKKYSLKDLKCKYYSHFLKIIPEKFVIYYKDRRLINIYNLKSKCYPFIKIKDFNVSSVDYLSLYCYSMIYQGRVINNIYLQNLFNSILYNLEQCKKLYYKKNNTNMLTDKLFRSFVYECKGTELDVYQYYKLNNKKERFNYKVTSKEPKKNNDSGILFNYLGEFRGNIDLDILNKEHKLKF
jgi:hypothetical protein